ncbi:MAG: TSUP family transporter [Steroidobacteraceae bacterium]|nr:TSUP family transporter [Steroidobacteraceae bacterium]
MPGGGFASLLFVLCAAGCAGFIDSMVGGGGLIQLPALIAGYPAEVPATLLGTNKLAGILGTCTAFARYAKAVRVPWRTVLPAAAIALPFALLGASLATVMSPAVFRGTVPLILTGVLIYVLSQRDLGSQHRPIALTGRRRVAALAGIAAIAAYDGFFGPGTGNFLMLFYVRVYGFDFISAAACARLINIATNAGALLYFGTHGHIRWPLALALGASNIAGSLLGAHTAIRRGSRFVRTAFVLVVLALIAKTALNAYL